MIKWILIGKNFKNWPFKNKLLRFNCMCLILLLFSCWFVSDSAAPWIAVRQASLSFTIPWSLLQPMSIELVCHPTISSSVTPFSSCLPSFPASGSFLVSRLFPWGSQNIGASASTSVVPMNIQGWLVWSPYSPRDSQESSPAPQFENSNSSALNLLSSLLLVHWDC